MEEASLHVASRLLFRLSVTYMLIRGQKVVELEIGRNIPHAVLNYTGF